MIIERTVQEELARIAAMLRDASERLMYFVLYKLREDGYAG